MFTKFLGYLFGIGVLGFLLAAGGVAYGIHYYSQDLPDYTVLSDYEPPVMTRVHASDGALIAEYASERRLFLPIQSMPDVLKAAFLSAEDKNFYQHGGLDFTGIARAIVVNIENLGSDRRPVGASTITQQVAKNFLLTSDVAIERKIREAILALRIERTFSKDEILELYLNEIYLGLGAYGIAAASLVYFDKSVHELTLAEAAYLAALPKAPNNYHPFRQTERALERRDWVLDRMYENGYITDEQRTAAQAEPLNVIPRDTGTFLEASDYFAEEVRREIAERYGNDGLYEGGLSVRTTLDPVLQSHARRAMRRGLEEFDRARGWREPVASIDITQDWGIALSEVEGLSDIEEWTLAVVLAVGEDGAQLGLMPPRLASRALSDERPTGFMPASAMSWAGSNPSDIVSAGDVVYVRPEPTESGETNYSLRQVPEVSGGMVAMDPYTGRVLAMVGGFSFDDSQFNRATQAWRQPGSSFKPFVYAAALDNGYTPSSVVMDAPIEIDQGPGLGIWRPDNYSNEFYGPQTLRVGIERSRNVMTVRLARDMGMPLVSEYARRFGVYDDLDPLLAMSLGSGETTVMRMTGAYAVIANGGRAIQPTLIDRVQDRYGNTIFRHDERLCEGCRVEAWQGQDEPNLIDERDQVLDPMTAYQVTSMLEGVVRRGTAAGISGELSNWAVAGKTGTTNDNRDAWFVGYSHDIAVGVYIGYDNPRDMGRSATGGGLAAPIFADFMQAALEGQPRTEFQVPRGISLIPIDRRTGLQVAAGTDGSILEAFRPGTSPPSSYSIIGFTDDMGRELTVDPQADRAVVSGTGGLY
ncbi:penicillin-binding protein 1A [Ahrensia marina]|jgi:penicillin-binding protein 1A|uniref:penicillin-binding protein 1A n=1 Tax=Ahrensia marina TaxID=1514904 RepID=UPI0035D0D083